MTAWQNDLNIVHKIDPKKDESKWKNDSKLETTMRVDECLQLPTWKIDSLKFT